MSFMTAYESDAENRPAWDTDTARMDVTGNTSRAIVMRFAHRNGFDRGNDSVEEHARPQTNSDAATPV
jgi:hypothetical protein